MSSPFDEHQAACKQCRTQPLNLCDEGYAALRSVAELAFACRHLPDAERVNYREIYRKIDADKQKK